MKLVAATPASIPLPDEIKTALGSISPDDLRDVVNRIAVPRVFGTPQNEAIQRVVIDLFSSRLGPETAIDVDEAGQPRGPAIPRRPVFSSGPTTIRSPVRRGPTTTLAPWRCCSPPLG